MSVCITVLRHESGLTHEFKYRCVDAVVPGRPVHYCMPLVYLGLASASSALCSWPGA